MPDEESISGATISGNDSNCAGKLDRSTDAGCKPAPQHAQGYQKLADFMSDYPAGACFRQFGSLNALNLLYYQAELCLLETLLKEQAERDRSSDDDFKKVYFQSHQWLSRGKTEAGELRPRDRIQWNIVLQIRETLKQYNDAILVQSQVNRLTRPRDEILQYIRDWITDDGNGEYVYLLGQDKEVYYKPTPFDTVALYAREYEDAISNWLTERALFWWNKFIGYRFQKASTSVYSRNTVVHLVTFLSIAIASTVPIVSVSILDAVESTKIKLGLMALFTVIFCLLFGLFSGAKKMELLAAPAALCSSAVIIAAIRLQQSSDSAALTLLRLRNIVIPRIAFHRKQD